MHVLLLAGAFAFRGPSTPSRNIVCVDRKALVSRSFLVRAMKDRLRCRNLCGHGFFMSRPHSYRF